MTSAVAEDYGRKPAELQGGERTLRCFGGAAEIRWDPDARVTPWGGLAFFAAFLNETGLFDRLVADAPFAYASPNAPKLRDLVGTIVLSILCGHTRYVHIERLRNDRAAAELFGMSKVVCNDSVRRALRRCDERTLDAWLLRHEREVTEALLRHDHVVDVDNTVKPVYGRQEGAERGYNPAKPGRPSHNYHSYFLGLARLTLGVDVQPGSRHSGSCGTPSLFAFLDALPAECRPRLLRGDIGYGTDAIMSEAERRDIPFLFKIRRTKRVLELFRRHERSGAWRDCGEGWEALETRLRLFGWGRSRRALVVRRPAGKAAGRGGSRGRGEAGQMEFELGDARTERRAWDFHVLVTSRTDLDAASLTALYRQRGDCENNFDETKNQWGWCGFVTRDLKPCRAMARLIALVANWWNVFCRLSEGGRHMEAATSRPALMQVNGRITESGRRRTIHLSSTHADRGEIESALTRVGVFLDRLSSTARQLTFEEKWTLVLRVAFRAFLHGKPVSPMSAGAQQLFAALLE